MPGSKLKRAMTPQSVWQPLRLATLDRDGYVCQNKSCRVALTTHDRRLHTHATVDHIVPLCDGGSDSFDNLRALCSRCNSRKGNLEQRAHKQRATGNTSLGLGASQEW